MTHLSENSQRLTVHTTAVDCVDKLAKAARGVTDVCVLRLPACAGDNPKEPLESIGQIVAEISVKLPKRATLIVIGEAIDLIYVHAALGKLMRYHLWIAIKRMHLRTTADASALPEHHFGALVYTHPSQQIQHTKTRIQYSYCPACDKTTKDYGGKKHTYHQYGTLISDIWRDIHCDLEGDISPVIERFADLFGVEQYHNLYVFDLRSLNLKRSSAGMCGADQQQGDETSLSANQVNVLVNGDCMEELRRLPDNSVDFAFTDPPYNLKKNYIGYADDLAISEYFSWCDDWITEIARVLKPGRTFAILNIPLWTIRHVLHMRNILTFQNWIAWDALSFPVRLIMPAHYGIVCFSKGKSRSLPGLTGKSGKSESVFAPAPFRSLQPLGEGFCLRARCVKSRSRMRMDDRGPLTDLWWDIHRVKHNSRRVDHPCQLPPQLMYRLVSVFTEPGEVVLDCFNGAGTTTLAAHQLDRKYIGMEMSAKYHQIAFERHQEVEMGIDPFRREERNLTAKNSPVARMPKQVYAVPKKTLQLDVKRIAEEIGHIPSREEVAKHSTYPIKYFDEYFISWGEVCAAARTTGMKEDRNDPDDPTPTSSQPRLF